MSSLPEPSAPVKLLTDDMLQELVRKAEASDRRRVNFNFHPDLADNPHRFLNVMLRGSYFTPHRHLHPPKAETFLVLEGEIAFVLFDDSGSVRTVHRMKPSGVRGIDIAPGLWHTLVVLSEHAVCFEVKPGPYVMTNDKEFAPFAPAEGTPGCAEYLAGLVSMIQADPQVR